MQPYCESPKVIIIAGPRCSGKTYISNKIVDEMMFKCISQDHVRLEIEKLIICLQMKCRNQKQKNTTKKIFMKRLRDARYSDIVLEGARLAHSFILDAFIEALNIEYGQYTIYKKFYLIPDIEVRYERYAGRIKKHIKEIKILLSSNNKNTAHIEKLASYITSPFDAFPIR